MKDQYRVVVIGGGVVGASVIYHLAKFGWTDVCLLERSVLTAGSSWHAAGGIHALNADPNIAALQAYTIDLLQEIEAESGQNIGLHMTGGLTMAGTEDRWEWLQSAYRVFQSIGIDDCRLVTPQEARELNPIMSIDGFLGGMWADREGYLDTTGTVHAYATAGGACCARLISVSECRRLRCSLPCPRGMKAGLQGCIDTCTLITSPPSREMKLSGDETNQEMKQEEMKQRR